MSRPRVCDICGKPAEIGAKLYLAPLKEGDAAVKTVHANYTAHMDVGICCMSNVTKLGRWTRRKKINRSRNENAVGTGKSAAA
jgi:hypothetical protein